MAIRSATRLAGSPAHAGIDPGVAGIGFCDGFSAPLWVIDPGVAGIGQGLAGFPRTRGDRPSHLTDTTSSQVVPPHTRG